MPASTLSNPQVSGLARVTAGWLGTIEVAVAGVTAKVIPPPRTSPAEVLDLLVRAARRTCGGTWRWWADATGRLVIVSSLTFDLVATFATQTRLGFTGTYEDSDGYTADDAHAGGIYPSEGLRIDGADGLLRGGAALATGLYVSVVRRERQAGTITLFGDYEELVDLTEWDGAAYDVVLGGYLAARVRIDEAGRAQRDLEPGITQLELRTVECTL